MSILAEWSMASLYENPKYQRCLDFPDLTPSPELSYMLGVRYGDLYVAKRSESPLQVKDKDFAEEFARCTSVVMDRRYEAKLIEKGSNKGLFEVRVNSKILSGFFKLSLKDHKEWVEPDYPAEFIRGFMDSDGNAHRNPGVIAGNTCKEILNCVNVLLKRYFGIYSSVTTPPSSVERVGKVSSYIHGKPVIPRKVKHILYITGLDNVEEFFWNIGFSIVRKSERLEYGLYGIPHPIWETRKRREERLRL